MQKEKCIYICTLPVIKKYCHTTERLQFNMRYLNDNITYLSNICMLLEKQPGVPRTEHLHICGLYSSNLQGWHTKINK